MELMPKQKRFVEEYLIDLNATQAAIRAGYSARSARQIGEKNMSKHDIKEAINKHMQKRSQRTEITADRVLQELAKIAFAKSADFAKVVTKTTPKMVWNNETEQFETKELAEQVVKIIDTDKLPEDKKAAIRAGYSEKTAYSMGQRLLKNVEIKKALIDANKERTERVEIDADWVLARLKLISDRCVQGEPILDKEGNPTGEWRTELVKT